MRALLLLAASSVLAGSPLAAQTVTPSGTSLVPQITVSGEGEARAVPDRAMITVGVQSRAATAAAAAAASARKQAAILDTLRRLGFSPEQLTTANYNVSPEMQYDQQGQRPRVTGYVVSNTVRVDVRRLEQTGAVIDAALARGANEIHGLNFYLSNPAPARRAAIADGVARARADAETLAQAAGGRVGQLLELSTAPAGPVPFQRPMMADARGGAESAAMTPISAGEETVRATVHARWAFIPNSP